MRLSGRKMRDIEFIWYCARKSCNMIVTKTKEPHLDSKAVYQCKRCNEKYRGDVLMILNKDNIKKTLDRFDNCP